MFENILEEIRQCLEHKEFVKAVVLFGSAARKQATKESDIDILIILSKRNQKAERYISDKIFGMEKKHKINIQYILTDERLGKINRQFLDTILREGIVIYGKLPEIPFQKLELEPFSLIKYDLTHMSHSDKMRIKLLLFGKETKKVVKGKTYVSKKKGFLDEYKGIRTGIASILVPERYSGLLETELRKRGAKLRVIHAWLQRV